MEAALDQRGNASALDELQSWLQNPRKSMQRKVADLDAALQNFADDPTSLMVHELNSLGPNLWELKIGKLRLPFVAANCSGTVSSSSIFRSLTLPNYVPQAPITAKCSRATHTFLKGSQKTPRKEIDRALAIGREDNLQ